MKRFFLFFWALTLVCFASQPAWSASQSPNDLVRQLSDQVMEILRTDTELKQGRTDQAVASLEKVVLPHFNLRRMTMLVVGKDWRNATADQRQRLEKGFYTLLVRTYSNALLQYRDQKVVIKPLRQSDNEKRARVQTEVSNPGREPVAVDYVLELKDGDWKVFDIVVAGVSLVTNYRGSFSKEISRSGLDGLIEAIENVQEPLKLDGAK